MIFHIVAAIKAMLKVTCVCGLGAFSFRSGMFDQPSIKIMSKLYIQILFPCLMFAKSIAVFTPANLSNLGVLFTISLLYLGLGHVVGYMILKIFESHLPAHFKYTIIPMTAYGNHGDLILSIIASIGSMPPFKAGDETLGVAYVAVFLVPCSLLIFATSPPFFKADNPKVDTSSDISSFETDSQYHSIKQKSNPHAILSMIQRSPIFTSIFNMPTVSILVGLIIAYIPGALPLLIPAETAPLSFIYTALDFLGAASVPLNLTLFGASLTTLSTDRQLFKQFPGIPWVFVLVVLFRLILMPVVGIVLVEYGLVCYLQWVSSDLKMLRFVLMIEAGVPTAQLVLILGQYYNPLGEAKEVASIMLVQYLFCFFSLTTILSVILHILSV